MTLDLKIRTDSKNAPSQPTLDDDPETCPTPKVQARALPSIISEEFPSMSTNGTNTVPKRPPTGSPTCLTIPSSEEYGPIEALGRSSDAQMFLSKSTLTVSSTTAEDGGSQQRSLSRARPSSAPPVQSNAGFSDHGRSGHAVGPDAETGPLTPTVDGPGSPDPSAEPPAARSSPAGAPRAVPSPVRGKPAPEPGAREEFLTAKLNDERKQCSGGRAPAPPAAGSFSHYGSVCFQIRNSSVKVVNHLSTSRPEEEHGDPAGPCAAASPRAVSPPRPSTPAAAPKTGDGPADPQVHGTRLCNWVGPASHLLIQRVHTLSWAVHRAGHEMGRPLLTHPPERSASARSGLQATSFDQHLRREVW